MHTKMVLHDINVVEISMCFFQIAYKFVFFLNSGRHRLGLWLLSDQNGEAYSWRSIFPWGAV